MHKILLILLIINNSIVMAASQINVATNKKEALDKIRNNDNYTFKEQARVVLPNGKVQVKHQQYYKGVKVWGGSMITAEPKR